MRGLRLFTLALMFLYSQASHAASVEGTSRPTTPASFQAPEVAEFDAALVRLGDSIRWKLEHELDTIGYAFWAVHDIDRARRAADIAGAPLAVLQAWLSWFSTLARFDDIRVTGGWEAVGQELLADAGSGTAWLSLSARLLHLRSVAKAGEDLAHGLYGPPYAESIRAMYNEAGRQRTEEAFAAVIKGYLKGQRSSRMLAIVPPEIARQRGIDGIITGSDAVLAAILGSIDRLRGRLPNIVPGDKAGEFTKAAEHYDDLARSIRRSVSASVAIGLDQGEHAGVSLGSVHGLQQLQIELLNRYAASMRQQQVEVSINLASSVVSGLLNLDLKLGGAENAIVTTVVDLTELGVGAASWATEVNVRELLAEVPQSMIWAMAAELETIWHRVELVLAAADEATLEMLAEDAARPAEDVAREAVAPGLDGAAADQIELDDGTVIVGATEEVSLPFASVFGTLQIETGEIAEFGYETLTLADGSILKGRFGDGALPVETARGRLELPANRIVSIRRDGAESAATADLSPTPQLPPGQGILTGQVLDQPFGQPVADALIRIGGSSFQTRSDKNGKFEISYIPGEIKLLVNHIDYIDGEFSFSIGTTSVYPASDIFLFRNPSEIGLLYIGEKGWIKINQCRIENESGRAGRVSWYRFLAVGTPSVIPPTEVHRFIDNVGLLVGNSEFSKLSMFIRNAPDFFIFRRDLRGQIWQVESEWGPPPAMPPGGFRDPSYLAVWDALKGLVEFSLPFSFEEERAQRKIFSVKLPPGDYVVTTLLLNKCFIFRVA